MTNAPGLSRRAFLEGAGILAVGWNSGFAWGAPSVSNGVKSPTGLRSTNPEDLDAWLTVSNTGKVTVYTGRIDMGTGTETVFGQFAAEELDVRFDQVKVVMGDTRLTPDQGKTTASYNVVRGAQPIRVAAATARTALIDLAATRLRAPASELETADGAVRLKSNPAAKLSYGALIGGGSFRITLELAGKTDDDIARGVMLKSKVPLKASKDFKVLGKSIARVDVPAKVIGSFEYVHNVRVPGMVHGRVIRPPAIGATLISFDDSALKAIPGARAVVRNNFLGVIANREEDAAYAARLVHAKWTASEVLPDSKSIYDELEKRKVVSRQTSYETGDVAGGLTKGDARLKAVYDFPFQDHAMIGPSCAIAEVSGDTATIWSGSQWPQGDRSDIAKMLGLKIENVQLIWKEASGSYGRLGCDDAAADAAVMSQIVKKPVRVQWTREDENVWEPVSPAMRMTVDGATTRTGQLIALDYMQYSPSHSTGEKGNHLAWHLIGGAPGWGRMSGAAPALWYNVADKRARNIYVEPWLRGIYLRAPGGIQAIFAYESFMSEMAAQIGIDPMQFRIQNCSDSRDIDVLKTVARISQWQPASGPKDKTSSILKGRGLAMGRYGPGDTRSALVADIELERQSGKIRVTHAYMAFDCGYVLNPDGAMNQVEGGLIQGISRTLHEEISFNKSNVTSTTWADYPILKFSELPEVKIELINRPNLPYSSVGEAGTVTTAAAIANAVFDALQKHPRRLPLRPEFLQTLIS